MLLFIYFIIIIIIIIIIILGPVHFGSKQMEAEFNSIQFFFYYLI